MTPPFDDETKLNVKGSRCELLSKMLAGQLRGNEDRSADTHNMACAIPSIIQHVMATTNPKDRIELDDRYYLILSMIQYIDDSEYMKSVAL